METLPCKRSLTHGFYWLFPSVTTFLHKHPVRLDCRTLSVHTNLSRPWLTSQPRPFCLTVGWPHSINVVTASLYQQAHYNPHFLYKETPCRNTHTWKPSSIFQSNGEQNVIFLAAINIDEALRRLG